MPLLIGGATTSRVHTAVKIHPRYERGQTVYVTDASRAVGVVSSLLSPEAKAPLRRRRARPSTPRSPRRTRAAEADKQRLPLAAARANALRIDWAGYAPPRPSFLGTRVFDGWDLADLARYIDWTPFFQTWELKGRYPEILEDEAQGEAARQLFDDAQAMLAKIVDEHWFRPRAAIGFWPANAVGDDIRLFTDEGRGERARDASTPCASSWRSGSGRPNVALADFVAPAGVPDYVGGFVVTAGHRGGGDRRALRAGERRLFGDPGQGARRPLRRGLRRGAARAGPPRVLGLRARRGASRPRS